MQDRVTMIIKATNTSAHVGANHLSIIPKINKDAFKFF